MKKVKLICICGEETEVNMVGNNNADGKAVCKCGRNITIHLRRHKSRLTKRAADGALPSYNCECGFIVAIGETECMRCHTPRR